MVPRARGLEEELRLRAHRVRCTASRGAGEVQKLLITNWFDLDEEEEQVPERDYEALTVVTLLMLILAAIILLWLFV